MIFEQKIKNEYAVYNGDNMELLPNLPDNSIHLTIYSPPFADLFAYSSSERDLSNCESYEQFLEHYEYVIKEIARITMPGRISAVHCMDIPIKGVKNGFEDFPGDIVRMYKRNGFVWTGRRVIWKEPLKMAIRTRAKGLEHRNMTKDAGMCDVAGGDYLLSFRKKGENPEPIIHNTGLQDYYGDDKPGWVDAETGTLYTFEDLKRKFSECTDQKKNRLSQVIWQRYASCAWYDIRQGNVLPYKSARENEEEKHVCPLQLDVIHRCIELWSNPGDKVLTPFMGIGSEVYCVVMQGRKGIGVELKPTYYRQALQNIEKALETTVIQQELELEFN